jgi:N-acetylmuramoyl-L-alanine amidase
MTYLDTGIVIKIVDSVKQDYRIQLSNNHFAYLPREFFQRDTSVKVPAYVLATSWVAFGDDRYDYVTIQLEQRLPYRSIHQINPSRIVVDIFGATSNTNWINLLSSAREIRNIYYEQTEDDVYRVFIELVHPQHWGHSIYYQEKKLVIRIKRQPADLRFEKLKIAVDAGHGGDNTGARGVRSNIAEKNYTLKIARELEKKLVDEKATVFMTRESDQSLSMADRIGMLKEQDPDLLISIHLNSSVRDTIRGVSTYYRYIGFKPLTQFILNKMLELGLKEFGNIGSFNFTLSGPTEYPNCLVEVAFLSNKDDEQLILDPEFHKAVAQQIVAGIKDWLKWCNQ